MSKENIFKSIRSVPISQRRLMIECIVASPSEMDGNKLLELIADYLNVNKFVLTVNRIQSYPPNSHLTVTEIANPTDTKQ